MRSVVAATVVTAFVVLFAVLARFDAHMAVAEQAPAAAPAAAGPPKCKLFKGSKCCEPAITAHLPKEAVFSACGESAATYLGEEASSDSCKYVFRNDKKEEGFVQVYAPAQKEVPSAPTDPFFKWKRLGKVYVTEKALSPKSAPLLAASTGLWLPGTGYFVSVNASTRTCTKAEAEHLAKSMH